MTYLDAVTVVAIVLGTWAGFSLSRESGLALTVFAAGVFLWLISTTPGLEFSRRWEEGLVIGCAVLLGSSIVIDRRGKRRRKRDAAGDR